MQKCWTKQSFASKQETQTTCSSVSRKRSHSMSTNDSWVSQNTQVHTTLVFEWWFRLFPMMQRQMAQLWMPHLFRASIRLWILLRITFWIVSSSVKIIVSPWLLTPSTISEMSSWRLLPSCCCCHPHLSFNAFFPDLQIVAPFSSFS